MEMRPISDKVLVRYSDVEITRGGIMIHSDNGKEKPAKGIVAALPKGEQYFNTDGTVVQIDLAIGDCVYFSRHTGDVVEFDGKKYMALRYNSILAASNETIDFDALEKSSSVSTEPKKGIFDN